MYKNESMEGLFVDTVAGRWESFISKFQRICWVEIIQIMNRTTVGYMRRQQARQPRRLAICLWRSATYFDPEDVLNFNLQLQDYTVLESRRPVSE
jgi:hypothetical protein